jgi:hypothetical protein
MSRISLAASSLKTKVFCLLSVQFQYNKIVRFRLFATLLIAALIAPTVFVGQPQRAKAQSLITSPAPISAPPEAFVMRGSGFKVLSGISLAATLAGNVSDFFVTAKLPEGFENAKVPTFADKMASALMLFLTPKGVTLNAPIPPPPTGSVSFDFDADGKADLGRWHSANTEFKVKNSNGGTYSTHTIGSSSSVLAPADYDGDGKTDAAVFSAGTWTIKQSSNGQTATISGFGQSGDLPVSGNYAGSSAIDAAVYRPSNNTWYVREAVNGTVTSGAFGTSGDIAVPGNYDGDGVMDLAVFRPSTGDWHISGSSAGYFAVHWGVASDIPVPADYDGDGKTDLAVYRGSTGDWYAAKSSTSYSTYFQQTWGNYGDQPVPADYDGDGKADFSVWRPTTGVWHTLKSSNGAYDYQTLGVAGDVAVPSSYLKQIGGQVVGYDLAKARLSPKNATGGTDLYSRNFSWGTSLVGLPGRAGMNAGFGMSYNSLVWTKQGSNIYFDTNADNISPGFRFGFPTIEPIYYDTVTAKFNYLMVTPSGGRVEFRQTAVSGTYETADSSYVQLKTKGADSPNDPVEDIDITITGTDGTQMEYRWSAGAYRCTQIKDRNGNYITINHDDQGVLRTVTDTLGRVITVNYDSGLYPTSITQTWKDNNGSGSNVTHTWASFSYTTKEITTSFSGLTVVGPPNGTVLKVLERVTFADGRSARFTHNSYGQVWKVQNYAPDGSNELNRVRTDLESPSSSQTDCPKFGQTISYIQNFNGGNETTVTNTIALGHQVADIDGATVTASLIQVQMLNHPNGNVTNTYVGESGWKEGLPIRTDDYAAGNGLELKRSSWMKWTQDDMNLTYILNPRVTDSKVGDGTNFKKTSTEYLLWPNSTVAKYGLVSAANVYDTDLSTVLKRVETDYNLSSTYTDKRIIGLPSETRGYGRETSGLNLMSKITYAYDDENFSLESNQIISPAQHDNSAYGSSFIAGRGNLTLTTRHDVTGQTVSVTSRVRYDIAGSPVAHLDPLNRKVAINYTDVFNTTGNPASYAYPTTVTDPAGNSSTAIYRYDIGANVEANSPAPAGNTYGKKTKRIFDDKGRLERDSIYINTTEHSYVRYEYPTNGVHSKGFAPIVDMDGDGNLGEDEVLSESWADGAGRLRQSRTEHPGSTGGYSGLIVEYDILGQVKRQSVRTEIDSSWNPAGDDNRGTGVWLWNSQEYDWKGRVTRIIPSDSNGSDGKDKIFSYDGCGCAGGQVTTIQGENIVETDWHGNNPTTLGRRTQKVYEDILGRNFKTEVYDWNGANVYATTVNTYNGRDQITNTYQYAGGEGSSTWRAITMNYDGVGRMRTRQYPIENLGTNTTWTYNSDDSINTVTDPRGVVTNFSYYPTTGLLHQITYDVPSGQAATVPDTPDVSYTYDNLGNRTAMTDGTGSASYAYNELSQMTSEIKNFNGLTNNFTINYTYNLSGGLKTMSDPQDSARKVVYNHNRIGRVVGVDMQVQSTATPWVFDTKYRAWGDLKDHKYNIVYPTATVVGTAEFGYDSRLQISNYEITGAVTLPISFSRYSDGSLKTAITSVPWQDRLYKYDHVGRLTKGYSGKDANGDPNVVAGPYKQDYTYNAFSEMTNLTGKQWGINVPAYIRSYDSASGRDGSTGYDAAGNVVTDRIRTTPTPVLNRTMKYDAAGRQVETFDPAVHTCCELDTTGFNYYDGNGWKVKGDGYAGPNQAIPTYEIRSTVLQGEKVGEFRPSPQYPQKKFITSVLGGELTYTNIVGYSETTDFVRKAPENFQYDPRGAEIGDEPEGGGGGSYPASADPSTFARCAEGGIPQSCDMQSRFNDAFDRIAGLIQKDIDEGKGKSTPKSGAGSSTVHESRHSDPAGEQTTVTDKTEPDPETPGTVDPASVPDGCTKNKDGSVACNVQSLPAEDPVLNTSTERISMSVQSRPLVEAPRRINSAEADVLRSSVTTAANNTQLCRQYIKDLIEKAAQNAHLDSNAIVSTKIETLFNTILGSRGGGNPDFGGIYITGGGSGGSGKNYWAWVGNPGFAQIDLDYTSAGLGDPSRNAGMITIHELLHVAIRSVKTDSDDEAYANAAADIAGVVRPVFTYDPSKPITATNRGTNYQASEYWGERLNQACGFPSQITGKMTNHKLY